MAMNWWECQACGMLKTNVGTIPLKCISCESADLWVEPGDEHPADFESAEETSLEDPTEDGE